MPEIFSPLHGDGPNRVLVCKRNDGIAKGNKRIDADQRFQWSSEASSQRRGAQRTPNVPRARRQLPPLFISITFAAVTHVIPRTAASATASFRTFFHVYTEQAFAHFASAGIAAPMNHRPAALLRRQDCTTPFWKIRVTDCCLGSVAPPQDSSECFVPAWRNSGVKCTGTCVSRHWHCVSRHWHNSGVKFWC